MIKFLRALGEFLLDFIETIVVALAIFVVVYLFLFQPHQVKGNSMLPNFENGEYILTNKIVYRFNRPQRGNVIVFKAPKNEDYDYIKRIIALPGETVKIQDDLIYINNQRLDELSNFFSPEKTPTGQFLQEGKEAVVPNNSYFVIGDNRNYSSDSRDWGFVPFENIVGLAWFSYWPLNKLGLISKN